MTIFIFIIWALSGMPAISITGDNRWFIAACFAVAIDLIGTLDKLSK